MSKSKLKFFVILLLSPNIAMAEPIQLTVKEAIKLAFEKNLDLKSELYNPAQAEADIFKAYGIYDPTLNLQTNYSDSTNESAAANALGRNVRARNLTLNSSITQLLPTGGTIGLSYNNNYYQNNSPANLYRNYWASSLGATFSQPLLKNFGKSATELTINIAKTSKNQSLEELNHKLLTTISQVKSTYFKLYSLRKQIETKKISLELAKKILSETKSRVAVGVTPAMEITSAEFSVSTREKELIDLEKNANDQSASLRVLLQLDSEDIITVDKPTEDPLEVDEKNSIEQALQRPDISAKRKALEVNNLKTKVYKRQTLPNLAFVASGSLNGLDRTYPDDLDKVLRADSPTWAVGLTFSYPLGNREAKNNYIKSVLESEQTALQIRSLEENAKNDVKSSIRNLKSAYKQISVTKRGAKYAQERLNAYVRKNQVGLATIKEVMDVENDLAVAKTNEINAATDYDNAITTYYQTTGELLNKEGVKYSEEDAKRLYDEHK